MAIKHPAFTPLKTEEQRAKDKRKVFPVSLNEQEQELLKEFMQVVQQDQPSKAIRQAFLIGCAYVIQDQKVNTTLGILFKNKRNNKRRDVIDFD